MPTFRERPLTWLFLVATLCVDLVLVVIVAQERDTGVAIWPSIICMSVMLAQLSMVAAWAAIGISHRLARGAALTIAVCLVTSFFFVSSFILWRELLTWFLLQGFVVWCATLMMRVAGLLKGWPSLAAKEKQIFQFPLIEMFGWTTIVAIWSLGMHYASRPTFFDSDWILIVPNWTLLPIIVVTALGLRRAWWVRLLIVFGFAIVIAFISADLSSGPMDRFLWYILLPANLVQSGYLVLWYVVQHLDAKRTAIAECPEPAGDEV